MFHFSEKPCSEAAIVDGILILTLPNAVRPVVWQMQLGQAKASALEVRDGADGNHILVVKTPRADSIEIASFSEKGQAVSALLAVSKVLTRAQGQLNIGPSRYPLPAVIPQRKSFFGRILRFIGGCFLFLIVLFAAWILLNLFARPHTPPVLGLDTTGASQQSDTSGGNPVNAEDFLNGQ